MINFYSSSYLSEGCDTFDHCFLLEIFLLLVSGQQHTLTLLQPWLLSLSLFNESSSSCQLINVVMSQGLVLGSFLYLLLLGWSQPAGFKCHLYANKSLIYTFSPTLNPRHIYLSYISTWKLLEVSQNRTLSPPLIKPWLLPIFFLMSLNTNWIHPVVWAKP